MITGVENFGLFITGIEIPAEGFVHISSLTDDYYRYDRAGHVIAGHRSGNSFRLGDRCAWPWRRWTWMHESWISGWSAVKQPANARRSKKIVAKRRASLAASRRKLRGGSRGKPGRKKKGRPG